MKPSEPNAGPATPRVDKTSPTEADLALRARLAEAEQTLAAIRTGEVDALVVQGPAGERIFTLEGAEHGYRVLMEAMSEGVATLNEQGLITFCNTRFTVILGARPEQTVGNPFLRLVPPADHERLRALLEAGTAGRSEGAFWLQAPSGSAPALVRLAVVGLTMDGARTHCLVMTDLTEQHWQGVASAAERARIEARLLVADRMSALGALAAGVAHEINNPLAYVIASLELMMARLSEAASQARTLDGEPIDWLRVQLTRAQAGAERVRVIVGGLQTFTQGDDETLGIIDPRRTLDTSITLLASKIRHRARLEADYETLPPHVWANESRLAQVFLNLLVNATQAIAPGDPTHNEIRVSGRADAEGRAVIEFRDTGSGIEAEHLTRIFDPFFTTKPLKAGTGLGLALCHAIITSLHGHITVESEPGKGSTFLVTLPSAEGAVPTAEVAMVKAAGVTPRGRLLFIDDEEEVCDLIREALASSHEVVTATSARQALVLLAAGHCFDVILCDVRMPDMTGIELYRQLETDNPAQASRMVLMSGGFTRLPGDPTIALPRRLFKKPFALEQVLSLMRDALQVAAPRSGQANVEAETD